MARYGKAKQILFAFILLILSLLALEGAARVWVLVKGLNQCPSAVQSEIRELISVLVDKIPMPERKGAAPPRDDADKMYLHPFYGMETDGGILALKRFRDVFLEENRDSNCFFILVVGGSVAGRMIQNTWNIFAKAVMEDPRFEGKRIVLIPFARGGFKQPQQSSIVSYLLSAGVEPDAVINIDGFNEAALSFNNAAKGTFPLYPSIAHWGYLITSQNDTESLLDPLAQVWDCRRRIESVAYSCLKYKVYYSTFLGRAALWYMQHLRKRYTIAYGRYTQALMVQTDQKTMRTLQGTEFDRSLVKIKRTVLDCWVNSSRSIQAMCDARSIYYLHVLQPTLADVGSKVLTKDEIRTGTIDTAWEVGVRTCYDSMRQEGSKLKALGVNFHDLSMVFAGMNETFYFDCCHFQGAGEDLFAASVAKAFLESFPASAPRK